MQNTKHFNTTCSDVEMRCIKFQKLTLLVALLDASQGDEVMQCALTMAAHFVHFQADRSRILPETYKNVYEK